MPEVGPLSRCSLERSACPRSRLGQPRRPSSCNCFLESQQAHRVLLRQSPGPRAPWRRNDRARTSAAGRRRLLQHSRTRVRDSLSCCSFLSSEAYTLDWASAQ